MAATGVVLVDILSMEVARKIKELKVTTDQELLSELRKTKETSISELNNMLLRLEILGLVTVTWMDKDRRRIEYREPAQEEGKEEPKEKEVVREGKEVEETS